MGKYIYYLVFFFLLGCSKKEKEAETKQILTLLEKGNDYNLSLSKRLRFILLAEKNLDAVQKNDSTYRHHYFTLAARYYNVEKYEDYLRVSRKAYDLGVKAKDELSKAKGLHYIGDYHFLKFKNDSAYYYFTKAEKKYDSLQLIKELIRVKFSKSDILLYEKDFSGSEVETIKVLKIAKAVNDHRLVYDCLVNLGNALLGLNNVEEAIAYYFKALSTTHQLETDPQYYSLNAQVLNYIGKAYAKKGEFKKAISFYNKALFETDLKVLDSYIYSSIISNKAFSDLKLGNYDEAESKLLETLHLREKQQNTPGLVLSNLYLGELYIAKKEFNKAVFYLLKAQKIANKNKIYEDELRVLKLLSSLKLPNKDALYERYIDLNDSLQNIERTKRNKFARIEYETDEILNEKKLIQEQKEQISSQRWFILFGSTGLILLLALLYNNKVQYSKNKQLQFEREQQESNEQIYKLMLKQQGLINEVRQQEKRRISQELHDGVMSRLTSTRLNLFVLSKRNDEETIKKCLKHIEDIQEIEKELRNISHDLNKESLLEKESFKVIINNLLEEYCEALQIQYQIKIDKNIVWDVVDGTTKIHLYRILQESLQNIYKYSKASHVNLSFKKVLDRIIIDIEDDGVGFEVTKVKEGIGLKNMSARVSSLDGQFKIYSALSKGTHINISLPY